VIDATVEIRRPRAQQRPLLQTEPRGWLVAVEGPIGVGKTTLARRLGAYFHAGVLLEVVEENPFLHSFYQDIRGRAFQTQIFFLLSRHRQQQSIISTLTAGGSMVADYTFAKDRLFAKLTLDDAELALYENVYELIAPLVPQPDAIVYLRAAVDTLVHRIEARGRSFERDLTPAYLARLSDAYEAFFAGFDAAPVIVVDSERLDPRRDRDLAAVADAVTEARR
jgi:deoxyadenosine/deoxycytidine kinase